ncbi:hypothetical protein [Lysobacter enzymogenes]|uniref:hypothetical protein n=1 Tax=Lysobacter enzymogenes TaxID=69 RepID=UPI00089D5706|nr:hypothetical protein [Lysobacter enzymogenes]SDW15587.1 hypothetical protein SAMN05421681_101264 [Lysobacter enzymogenes]
MNAIVRKRCYTLAATVLGMSTMILALETPGPGISSPWLGLGLLLAGAAAAAACAIAAWRIDADPPAQTHAQVRDALRDGGVRGVGGDPGWTIAVFVAAAVACGWLAWAQASQGRIIPALLAAALAALGATGSVWRWRTRMHRRELRIDAAGVHSPDFGLIVWADVVGLRRYRAQLSSVDCEGLQLLLRDPGRYAARAPAWLRRISGLDAPGQRYAPLLLPLDVYGIPVEAAYVAATTLRRRAGTPFVEGWHPRMETAEIDELLAAPAPQPLPAADAPWREDPLLPMVRRQLRHHRREQRRIESMFLWRSLVIPATALGYIALHLLIERLLA